MHGQPRKPLNPENVADSIAKAANLRNLQSQLLHNHHNNIYTEEALQISSKLLGVNPEAYTAWNYRKLAVQHNLCSETDPVAIKSILDEELKVVQSALLQNSKSYGAWHHRKWVLSKGHSSLDHEFWLLDRFQKADSRNFHAWNYRRFVAALKNVADEEELQFTTNMIGANFSNYSAWHNRSVLLSRLLKQRVQGFVSNKDVLANEYELIHNAFFTDPDDQSGWFYHLWLLDLTVKPDAPLLVSSWPAHGTELIVSSNGNFDFCASYPFTSFPLDSGAFPLILYFNQSVEGINLSTVSVESLFNWNKNLVWTPLSTSNTRSAQAWVTYLKFPDVRDYSVKSYPVRVRLGHAECITSTSGSYFCCPCEFAFTIVFRPIESEYTEGSPEMEMVVWKNNRFHTDAALLQEMSPTVVSFDQLAIKMEPNLTFSSWHVQTIEEEINCFRMLISLNDCKIGKLTLARLLMAHDAMMSYNLCCLGSGGSVQQDVHHTPCTQKDECSDTSKASINSCIKTPATFRSIHSKEVLELFSDLMKLDPSHYGYYKDEHSLVLLKQITSSRELLLRHCQYYGGSASLKARNSVCLRLNNLSLSRIGSIEHLLWVQMLDLSHNELQSIEGLGAMQLLSCLNLSNNKFSSFTSLEPLRLLKSLKVLDISYNEFGAHSIDTRRYLCSSPLSHTLGSDWIVDYAPEGISVTEYWEAMMIFRGLHLTQLDIVGNAVTGEKFKSLLVKILPTLRWLDGEDVQ